jgi:ABC-2 type transport system ATP-binding protein
LIEAQRLTRYYGDRPAVDDVSFVAEQGEILGFLGPNGAGKTTTMRMLTCFLPPTRGTARIAGFDILDDSMEVRRRIGYLPENVPLYTDLTVASYLDFVATLKGMGRSERLRGVGRVMEECGVDDVQTRVDDVQTRPIGKLSRGYRQRVGLAQALVNDPDVLILDEPTVGLDPRQIIEIRELIRSLAGERTVILSTHILPEASLLCRRVIIINEGRLVTDDTPENLGRSIRSSSVVEIQARGDVGAIQRCVAGTDGVTAVTRLESSGEVHRFRVESMEESDVREALAAALVAQGFGLLALTPRDVSLEDVFVRVVTEEVVADD